MKKFKEFLNEENLDPKKFLTDEQIKWCDNHIRNGWEIDSKGEVETKHSLFFIGGEAITEFPVQFADIKGDFSGYELSSLTSLKGSPRKVGGSFTCFKVPIETLEGAPREIAGTYFFIEDCANLISLEGLPKKFQKLVCDNCPKLPRAEQEFAYDEDLQEEWKKSPLEWKQFMYGGAAKGRKFGL